MICVIGVSYKYGWMTDGVCLTLVCNFIKIKKGICTCVPSSTSSDFWSKINSLNDNDSECYAGWFEGTEPNMIAFCLSLDVICGSWKYKERKITLTVGLQFHQINVMALWAWQMVTKINVYSKKDIDKIIIVLGQCKSINHIYVD